MAITMAQFDTIWADFYEDNKEAEVGFFNHGVTGALDGFGQSSMTSRGPDPFHIQQLQQQQAQSNRTAMLYPGQCWETEWCEEQPKPKFINCHECDNPLEWSMDLDAYPKCSCGWRKGDLTSEGWLKMRIEEVTG